MKEDGWAKLLLLYDAGCIRSFGPKKARPVPAAVQHNLGVVADLTRQFQQKLDSSASPKKIPLMESEAAREFLNRVVFSKGSVDERFRDK